MLQQRPSQNVAQKETADMLKVPQGNVPRLESGSRAPTIATLQKGLPLEIRFGNRVVSINKGRA